MASKNSLYEVLRAWSDNLPILVLRTSVLFSNFKEWYYTTKNVYASYIALQAAQIAAAASTFFRTVTVMRKDELSHFL